MCGKTFEGGPRATYCKDCRSKRAKERDYKRREKTTKRRIGDIDRCLICNTPYIVKASGAKYCPDCKLAMIKQHKKRPTQRPLGSTDICEKCGEKYIVTGGKQKYCPSCGKEVHDAAINERKRAQSENNIGSIIRCQYCGKEFIKTAPRQFYCSNCKEIAVREIDQEQGLEYYYKHRDEINEHKRVKRKENKENDKT